MKKMLEMIMIVSFLILIVVGVGHSFKSGLGTNHKFNSVLNLFHQADNEDEIKKISEKALYGLQIRTKNDKTYEIVQCLESGDLESIKSDLNLNPNILSIDKDKIYFYERNEGLKYIDTSNSNEITSEEKFNEKYSNLNSLIYVLDNNIYFVYNNNLIVYNFDTCLENIIDKNISWNGFFVDKINKKIYILKNNELYNTDLNGENVNKIYTGIYLTPNNGWLGIINNKLILECYGINKSDEKIKKLLFYDFETKVMDKIENEYSAIRCNTSIVFIRNDITTRKCSISKISDVNDIDNIDIVFEPKQHEKGIKYYKKTIEMYERITTIWYDKNDKIVVSIDDGTGISKNGRNKIYSVSLFDKSINEFNEGIYTCMVIYE